MKNTLFRIVALVMLLTLLTSCGDGGSTGEEGGAGGSSQSDGGPRDKLESEKMIAKITKIEDKIIEVEAESTDVFYGVYRVHLVATTAYVNTTGEYLTKDILHVGDKVEIGFNGQVMRSLPPQIVAHKITVIE